MKYAMEYATKASKQLFKLDKATAKNIFKKIQELKKNPDLGKPLGNVFKNQRSLHIGKLRVIYSIKKDTIIIAGIKHRKKAYKIQ